MSQQWVDDLLLFICMACLLSASLLAAANTLGVRGGLGNAYHMIA